MKQNELRVERIFLIHNILRSKATDQEQKLRSEIYLGYFSLAGYCMFTAIVHFFFMCAAIIVRFVIEKDVEPSKITQSINVWASGLKNVEIMFPLSHIIADNISLADTCQPFRPKTIPYDTGSATIFPKILLLCEIDNRISIALFFFLSFAFQFSKTVNFELSSSCPFIHNVRIGETYYRELAQGRINKIHYVEYSVSATLMILVMITQIGLTDFSLILNVCVNAWACMIIGLLTEHIVDAEKDESFREHASYGYNLSVLSHILGWIPLLSVIFTMLAPLVTYKACVLGKIEIPDFVFAFVIGEILLFCSFGLVQFASVINVQRIRDVKITDVGSLTKIQYMEESLINNACAVEFWYITLSLIAKTFLALTIYIGINMKPG
jgi:hypothetical protein